MIQLLFEFTISLLFQSSIVANAASSACTIRLRAAARLEGARALGLDLDQVRIKFVDDAVRTQVARDNWITARASLGFERRAAIVLVTARQVGAGDECTIASAVTLETRTLDVDRTRDAERLASVHPPDGMWRALEWIDRTIAPLSQKFPCARVELIDGNSRADVGQPLTLEYHLGWSPSPGGCAFERVLTVRYTRATTWPELHVIAERGDPLP